MPQLTLSVITLSYDNQCYTEKFVNSIRKNTIVDYELIIVDNGSEQITKQWVQENADNYILNDFNLGFAKGFNAGIEIAKGKYIMMANNDTEFPEKWDINLIESFNYKSDIGMVSPAYTSGAGIVGLRQSAGTNQIVLTKFGSYPSGVAYFSKKKLIKEVFKGWSEDYHLASGEDADFCYRIWSRNFDIIIDERVLIKHEGKVTTKTKIIKWKKLWKKNARKFRMKWAFYYYFKPIARIFVKVRYE